jgi:cold-inducible RNA-binding protein
LKNIFVGNLDFGATEDTVRSLFEAYGTVERVSLMTDRETGRSRGFAFVGVEWRECRRARFECQ